MSQLHDLSQLALPARSERRASARVPFCTPVTCLLEGRSLDAVTADLSRRGVYITTPRPLEVGTEFEIRFAVCGLCVVATAEVMHSSPGRGMGVKFVVLSEEDESLIGTVIDYHLCRGVR